MTSNRLKHAAMWTALLMAILIGGCEEPVGPETDLDALHAAAQASEGDPWWLIAPPDSVRFGGSFYNAETEIRLSWLWPDTADAVRVFRHIGPHSGEIFQSCEPACPYPYSVDWHNIGTVERDEDEWGSFSDGDLNPPIEDVTDRGLDGLYSYFLEAVVYDDETGQRVRSSRSEETPILSTHTRGIQAPTGIIIPESNRTPNSLTLTWTDNSSVEEGYKILSYECLNHAGTSWCNSAGDTVVHVHFHGNATSYQVTSLTADTEYCFRVRAFDHLGESYDGHAPGGDNEPCGRTLPESEPPPPPPPPPSDETATVWLENEQIYQGYAAYRGRFGPIVTGPPYLAKIENVSDRGLLFVKAGRNTAECGNPSAVVGLEPGQETTPSMLEEIWGTSMPPLGPKSPLYFTACATGKVVNMIPIKISYRYMNSDGPPDTVPDRFRDPRSGRLPLPRSMSLR